MLPLDRRSAVWFNPLYWWRKRVVAQADWEPVSVLESDADWISLNIVGESFRNDDGRSRQTVISLCTPGDLIQLVPEPANPYDPNALAVFAGSGQIGYIDRQHNRWSGGKIRSGLLAEVRIERIVGAQNESASLGVVLKLRFGADS